MPITYGVSLVQKELYGPEGTIVFKKQREEMLLKKRERKYDATLVRVEFADKVLIQAYFRPNEVSGSYSLILKSFFFYLGINVRDANSLQRALDLLC